MSARPEVARFMAALERTQYLPPELLEAYQRRLLDVLLRHAGSQTDFYVDRLAPLFRGDDSIDWERWREVPVLTRREAQARRNELVARTMPQMAGKAVASTSSGSTGRPFSHLTTGLQNLGSACANERFLEWHRVDPARLAAAILSPKYPGTAYPDGHRAAGWRVAHQESEVAELSITTPVDLQIEWLRRVRPAYLTTYPHNLAELGRAAAAEGAPLELAAVMTIGEMLTADARRIIRDTLGTEPLDRYGSTEVGAIAGVCPECRRHHVNAELVRIEILGEDDAPVGPGVAGRIIATPVYNLAMPLIRYDTGDYGIAAADPCPCGRTLPVLARILGRTRNMFHFADGTRIWPDVDSQEMVRFVCFEQFQVVQTALDRVEFRYVPSKADPRMDLAGLTTHLRERLHPSVSVVPVVVAVVPRSPTGKFEDCVCAIE